MTTARNHAKPRALPNGKAYCVEDSVTRGDMEDCALDLEDTLFLSEGDKARLFTLIERTADRLRFARNPCGFFGRTFRPAKCKLEPIKP